MTLRDYTVHEVGDQLFRKLTQPTSGGKVGDPGLVGKRPGILLIDQIAAGAGVPTAEVGCATVKFNGSHRFNAHAVTAGGNSAIALGDELYYDAAPGGSNPVINKDSTNGVFFGYAASTLASGTAGVVVVDFR